MWTVVGPPSSEAEVVTLIIVIIILFCLLLWKNILSHSYSILRNSYLLYEKYKKKSDLNTLKKSENIRDLIKNICQN